MSIVVFLGTPNCEEVVNEERPRIAVSKMSPIPTKSITVPI
jgi:hypothetical protein